MISTKIRRRVSLNAEARTGMRCPESGVWKVLGAHATAPIAKGNVMPPYKGLAVTWKLTVYA